MKQKKVVILYRSPQNLSNNKAIQFIKGNLEEVFGEYVLFENCFMADLQSEKNLRADAFLAIDERVFEKAREYIRDFSRVIKIERSFTRSMLKEISDLPAGTDILVVNDSYTTALDTVYLFYETGISHVNLIPFDRKKESTGIYNHLTTAITPAERHFVPEHIKKVIDIGYRYVSFDTMLKLMKMLDLDNGIVNRALNSKNETEIAQYIERINEVINNNLITITAACRNRITTNNEIDWYSMGTFYQTLDEESIYNNIRKARINEVWYFKLNIIEEGRSPYE